MHSPQNLCPHCVIRPVEIFSRQIGQSSSSVRVCDIVMMSPKSISGKFCQCLDENGGWRRQRCPLLGIASSQDIVDSGALEQDELTIDCYRVCRLLKCWENIIQNLDSLKVKTTFRSLVFSLSCKVFSSLVFLQVPRDFRCQGLREISDVFGPMLV